MWQQRRFWCKSESDTGSAAGGREQYDQDPDLVNQKPGSKERFTALPESWSR